MRTSTLHIILVFTICSWLSISSHTALAQNIDKEAITGAWDIQGNLMGDDGKGWLMPHTQSNPDCEADHTVFSENNKAKDVKYNNSCEAKENTFDWILNDNALTLTKGERSIKWHIKSIEDDKMTVGVPVRPGSEKKLYVVYKKRK